MKLELQVCSLELAKKLKELGVKQDSLWYWVQEKAFPKNVSVFYKRDLPDEIDINAFHIYSAFTVAELGELLPSEYDGEGIIFFKGVDGDAYYADCPKTKLGFWAKTEADSKAKMLIYLKENK